MSEVEKYVKYNKHLPGMLSAKEMVEQGNDLHKTDAKLLKKLEELTLYSIQLDKLNSKQKLLNECQQDEISALKKMVKLLMNK